MERVNGRGEDSPTSIAFAITVFLAMPVFLSLSGTVTVFTQFGCLDLVAVHAFRDGECFRISIQCWNRGVLSVTIEEVDLNGVAQNIADLPITLGPSEGTVLEFRVKSDRSFVSGVPIIVVLQASDALHHVEIVYPHPS